jgi:hypothetical protein
MIPYCTGNLPVSFCFYAQHDQCFSPKIFHTYYSPDNKSKIAHDALVYNLNIFVHHKKEHRYRVIFSGGSLWVLHE